MINYIKNISINSPYRVILLSLLLSIFIGSGVRWFFIDDDFFKMFPEDLESRILWEDMVEEFGDSEFLFIAFGKSGEDIYDTKVIDRVIRLTKEIEKISIVDRVISLSNIDKVVSDPEDDTWIYIEKLFNSDVITEEDIISAKEYLNKNPDIRDRLISNDQSYTAVIVRSLINNDEGGYRNNAILIEQVKPIVDKYLDGYDIHYAGNPYITGEVPKIIRKDAIGLMISGILIMFLLLYINIRNLKAVGLIFSIILLSVVCMNGFMGWLFHLTGYGIFNFTIINTSMPIVLLTIANSDGVHIVTHFFKKIRLDEKKNAIQSTMDALRLPISLTSITTIIAFLAMVYSPIPQMMGYGFCVSFGIFWAWFLSNTLLPSMLLVCRWDVKSSSIANMGIIEKNIKKITSLICKSPKRTLSIGVFLVLVGIVGITLVKVEVNIIKFFKEGNSIRESTEFVDENFSGTMSLLLRVNADMKDPSTLNVLSEIQSQIESHSEVRMTLSLADIVKQMHKTLYNDERYYTIPDSLNQVSNLIFMAPSDQLSTVVNSTTYKTGMIHSYLISLSTDKIVDISNDIQSYIESNVSNEIEIESSGLMILLRDFISLVISSSIISIGVSILAIYFISLIFFRGAFWASMSIIPLTSAVILNFGLMGLFGIKLSHITALLTSIIIGVGVDFAVHYISSYKRHLKHMKDKDKLTSTVMNDVGYPIMLDVISNMGFGALLFSDLIPLNYMGGLMIFAMLSTSFGTFILMGTTIEIINRRNRYYVIRSKS